MVEDDRGIASALSQALRNSYSIELASTGKQALYKADCDKYDLVILDLNLPDIHGLAVCQQLRERGNSAPIIVLSGENRTLTKISLLDAGANDYLTKPFSLGELKARLRTLKRNQQRQFIKREALSVSGISLNRQTFEASRDGIVIKLRRKEFALLECLLENAGSVVSRDSLLRMVWRGNNELWANTIDVHIKFLRDKIDRPFERHLIKTVHGLGYKFEEIRPTVNQDV
jgi:two-component system OmpR family response regulator